MKRLYSRLLPLFPYLIVFIYSLYAVGDPDLGWHLKYGEYFFKHGSLLRDNTFSTMMPAYHWANTSWMTDVIAYAVFHALGFLGLSLLGALIVAITFYFVAKVASLTLWEISFLFPFLLYLEQPVNAVSFRGQQFSMLFTVIMFYLFKRSRENPKTLWWAVPLFILWANVNGEFLFGLGLFLLWLILSFVIPRLHKFQFLRLNEIRKGLIFPVTVFVSSLLGTLLNPFGVGIHEAAISHVGSPLLKYVAEYLPFEMLSQVWWNQVIVAVLIVLAFLYLFFKNKVTQQLPLLFTFLFVFVLSFEVRRYAWPAYYLVIPLLTPVANYFRPDSKKVTEWFTLIYLFVLLGIGIGAKYPFTQLVKYDWNAYCQNQVTKCSPASAAYLSSHHLTDKLFSLYGWGGWLIWNYPQIKPTIDGRMHLWQENGYSAFRDYYDYEQNFKDIDKSPYNIVYMSPDKPIFDQMIRLVNRGKWKQVYDDGVAGIFIRNK